MRFLPIDDSIDAIEKWQIGRPASTICSRFGVKNRENPDQELPRGKNILAGRMVQYFGGSKNKGPAWGPYL